VFYCVFTAKSNSERISKVKIRRSCLRISSCIFLTHSIYCTIVLHFSSVFNRAAKLAKYKSAEKS